MRIDEDSDTVSLTDELGDFIGMTENVAFDYDEDVHAYENSIASKDAIELIKEFSDTRNLHKGICGDRIRFGSEKAGIYRGQEGSSVANFRSVIKYNNKWMPKNRVRFTSPENVCSEIGALSDVVRALLTDDYLDDEKFLMDLSYLFWRFLDIHPYTDGNGRVIRFVVKHIALARDVSVSPNWTISSRPYSHAMGICLQSFRMHPELLKNYMREWFGVWGKK